jgi:hypothetical protein
MELHDTVRRLLEQCPGEHLCDACLAFACSVSLTEIGPYRLIPHHKSVAIGTFDLT